jgi:hypothetical protein
MKIKMLLKDPDGVFDAVAQAARIAAREHIETVLSHSEMKKEIERMGFDHIAEILSTWIEANEYVELEFDTYANTARVVPIKVEK